MSPPGVSAGGPERLQKVLARAGVASRRACEELILAGRVRVNGQTAVLGGRADPSCDRVELDGVVLSLAPDAVHYLLNKPRGVISAAADPLGRPCVTDLVPKSPRVFPVGRLDYDSEGLILLTNDGNLAHLLTHPSSGVEKEYLVEVQGHPGPSALARLRRGVELEDGLTSPARVSLVAPNVLKIVIHEGRNRQVRRMAEAVGHPVRRLVRTRLGPLRLTGVPEGGYRAVERAEVRALEKAVVAHRSPRLPPRGATRREPSPMSRSRS